MLAPDDGVAFATIVVGEETVLLLAGELTVTLAAQGTTQATAVTIVRTNCLYTGDAPLIFGVGTGGPTCAKVSEHQLSLKHKRNVFNDFRARVLVAY
jgi:hypothetical protein